MVSCCDTYYDNVWVVAAVKHKKLFIKSSTLLTLLLQKLLHPSSMQNSFFITLGLHLGFHVQLASTPIGLRCKNTKNKNEIKNCKNEAFKKREKFNKQRNSKSNKSDLKN